MMPVSLKSNRRFLGILVVPFASALALLALLAPVVAQPGAAETPKLTISPANVIVALGDTASFKAELNGVATTKVTWSILPENGISSGLGDVDTKGNFSAPLQFPKVTKVLVQANSIADPKLRAIADVTLINAPPFIHYGNPSPLPIGYSLLYLTGTGFLPDARITFNGQEIPTDFISTTQVAAVVNVPSEGSYPIHITNPAPGGMASKDVVFKTAPSWAPSYTGAVRFLEQSTFGPTPALIQHVQQVGYGNFLNEQFNSNVTRWSTSPAGDSKAAVPPQFYTAAINNADQLRQRVALALSEIFVTSGVKLTNSYAVAAWQNMLLADAFTTYPKLLKDVTLSPSMGNYLDMAGNAKADPVAGTSPDENYAREILQLFSIGLNELNDDGTLALDANGNPIPTYTQATVENFAAAFTGWTYPPEPWITDSWWNPEHYGSPMVAFQEYHDTNPKTLLNGYELPAGQTAAADLDHALLNITSHHNVGPFFCTQLIQHLVTSNPSPAYVKRVAAVFNNDGNGVRGNLAAVVRAILLDPEARAGDNAPAAADYGHMREPALFLAGTMRAFNGFANPISNYTWDQGASMGEDITNSPDVFNYFPITYQVASTGQVAPEMGIFYTATALGRADWVASLTFGIGKFGYDNTYSLADWTSIPNDSLLLDKMNLFFLHGQMSASLRQAIFTAMSAYPANQRTQKIEQALYVLLTSPEYQVEQ
jgi:uncharacterized protein (DUF1800 family)